MGIPADLVRQRPDVRRAERNATAQAEQIGIAESDFYPHLSLNGGFSYSAEEFPQLFNASALYGTWGPSFQWNLLNYGRILNNVRAQDAMFQELVAHYQNTVLNAAREVENGLISFLKSQAQMQYMAESVRAAEKAVTIAIAQYKGGLVDFNRVSLVEQNLVQQQNAYAQAYGAIALGLVNTYRALGGGWQIRLDPAAGGAPGLPPPDPNYRGDHAAAPMPLLSPPAQVAPGPLKQPEPVAPPSALPTPAPPLLQPPGNNPATNPPQAGQAPPQSSSATPRRQPAIDFGPRFWSSFTGPAS